MLNLYLYTLHIGVLGDYSIYFLEQQLVDWSMTD